jgi:hypothetical protein
MAIAEPELELLQNACRAMACRGLLATVLQRLFEGRRFGTAEAKDQGLLPASKESPL